MRDGASMARDYSTVGEKSAMGARVGAFLLLGKTSTGQRALPPGAEFGNTVELTRILFGRLIA